MSKRGEKHYIDGLAGILVFVLFAVCILSALLSGAGVYKRLTARDERAFSQRSCAQYVATKLRQAENAQAVSVLPFGDGDALCISEDIGGRKYATYVYCSDGWLRELFAEEDAALEPGAGEKLLEATTLELDENGGLLTVRISGADGEQTCLSFALRGGEAGA